MNRFIDSIPIYIQLKAELEEPILRGLIKVDESIDSIRSLAAQYSINPLTVSKAVKELEDEGTIYKKRGIGFYVTRNAQDNLRRKYMQEYLDKDVTNFVQKAIQLGIDMETIVGLIEENYHKIKSEAGNGN
jgi:DNA-binding transcriptional regulator YhcF (GntR family)